MLANSRKFRSSYSIAKAKEQLNLKISFRLTVLPSQVFGKCIIGGSFWKDVPEEATDPLEWQQLYNVVSLARGHVVRSSIPQCTLSKEKTEKQMGKESAFVCACVRARALRELCALREREKVGGRASHAWE